MRKQTMSQKLYTILKTPLTWFTIKTYTIHILEGEKQHKTTKLGLITEFQLTHDHFDQQDEEADVEIDEIKWGWAIVPVHQLRVSSDQRINGSQPTVQIKIQSN